MNLFGWLMLEFVVLMSVCKSRSLSLEMKDILYHNRKSTTKPFSKHHIVGIKMCVARCVERAGCQAVQFDIYHLSCDVMIINSSQTNLEYRDGIVFADRYPWEIVSECGTQACGISSRCFTTRGGKQHTSMHKCVEPVHVQPSSSVKTVTSADAEMTGCLIFVPETNAVSLIDRKQQSILPLTWKKDPLCLFSTVSYDKLKLCFLCRTRNQVAVASLTDRCLTVEGYIGLPAPKKTTCLSLVVDIPNGVMFLATVQGKFKVNRYEMMHDIATDWKTMAVSSTPLHMLQIDKRRRHIYWMETQLTRMRYSGVGLKTFPLIRMPYFFIDSKGMTPVLYGCHMGIVLRTDLIQPRDTTYLSKKRNNCNGIWRLFNQTYIKLFRNRGLWLVKKGDIVQQWSKDISFNKLILINIE